MTTLRLALVQEASGLDPATNRDRLAELVPDGTDLVVLPEAFARDFGEAGSDVSGYAEGLDGAFATEVARVARARGTTVVAGMFETGPTPQRPYNTLVVRGAVEASYRKIHLYDSFGYRESDRLSAGAPEPVLVDVAGVRVGLMTCYDLRFPELARLLVDRGAAAARGAGGLGGRRAQGGPLAHAAARAGDREHRLRGRRRPARAALQRALDGGGPARGRARRGRGRRHHAARRAGPGGPRAGPPDQPLAGQPASVTFLVVPSSAPRRRAERPASRGAQLLARAGSRLGPLAGSATGPGAPVAAWGLLVLAGAAALGAAMVPVGPAWLAGAGAVAVSAAYAWALAARTGGRPVVFGALALAMGVAVLVSDDVRLRTGAAVLTCVVSAVLGVMATVPARRFRHAAREVAVALVIAAVGALATVGFAPAIALTRFEYSTLGLAFLGAFGLVYRLGAGLHGLGRRGVLAVLVGGVLLALTLAYAELLRRYGSPGRGRPGCSTACTGAGTTSAPSRGRSRRCSGVPALAWGCHMRARRRQGWWVCAFGVAATTPVAQALLDPRIGLLESGLSVAYGAAVGLAIGYLLIRVDLRVTGPRGRRARRAEEAAAGRPEPARTRALL